MDFDRLIETDSPKIVRNLMECSEANVSSLARNLVAKWKNSPLEAQGSMRRESRESELSHPERNVYTPNSSQSERQTETPWNLLIENRLLNQRATKNQAQENVLFQEVLARLII